MKILVINDKYYSVKSRPVYLADIVIRLKNDGTLHVLKNRHGHETGLVGKINEILDFDVDMTKNYEVFTPQEV